MLEPSGPWRASAVRPVTESSRSGVVISKELALESSPHVSSPQQLGHARWRAQDPCDLPTARPLAMSSYPLAPLAPRRPVAARSAGCTRFPTRGRFRRIVGLFGALGDCLEALRPAGHTSKCDSVLGGRLAGGVGRQNQRRSRTAEVRRLRGRERARERQAIGNRPEIKISAASPDGG